MSDAIVLSNEKNKLMAALSSFASALSNLTPEQVPAAFEMADNMKDLSEEVRTRLRDRLLTELDTYGEQYTDKGSRSMSLGGFKIAAIPTRTGVDPKKLEALLRRLKLDPTVAMDAKVTYAVNQTKVMQAISDSKLTAEDVAACQYDKAFRVQVEHE
jgi:hypothetical protein